MNRELLEKPFDPAQIKQRRGRDGMLDYVEGHAVIARLNEAFEGQWSFEILRHDILEERDEILVLGKLSAEGVVKMQFGVSQITRDRETKEIVSLGDDVKAAGTDALKKCATFLGVGLHLYGERSRSRSAALGGDRGRGGGVTGRRERRPQASPSPLAPSGNDQERATQEPAPEKRGGAEGPPVPSPEQTGQPASGQATPQANLPVAPPAAPRLPVPERQTGQAGNGRLDNAQHTAILALAKKRRLSRLELDLEALKRYGVQIPYLTYADAAHFIQELQSMR
jgi:hypothetical protein